jgi:hypothetical protein
MITSLASKSAEKVWNGERIKKLPWEIKRLEQEN